MTSEKDTPEKQKEEGFKGSTQIIIALIGVVGVLGAAFFANWEKIFPKNSQDKTTVPTIQSNGQISPAPISNISRSRNDE
jgi:hypothetical protein